MGFDPLTAKGMPLYRQLRNWSQLNVRPYDPLTVAPYTRARIIVLNALEMEGIAFSHQFARHVRDPDLKRSLALIRRIEQQQQKAINWLIPAEESTLLLTIALAQAAVDLTAHLAQAEPDPDLRALFDFCLVEDFDHLFRFANVLHMSEGKRAEDIVGHLTEITPGRPTIAEHRHPYDDLHQPLQLSQDALTSMLHVMTLLALEQQAMQYYMHAGNRLAEPVARGLYQEIAEISEQHVSLYESLLDPAASWLQRLVLHEYHECYVYYSLLQDERDPRLRGLWESHLEMEIEHLQFACKLIDQYEGRDARAFLPAEAPPPMRFQSNQDYVRAILAQQVDLTVRDTELVSLHQLPPDSRYVQYQRAVNGKGEVPSQLVINEHIARTGQDYRWERAPNPVPRLRDRDWPSR